MSLMETRTHRFSDKMKNLNRVYSESEGVMPGEKMDPLCPSGGIKTEAHLIEESSETVS